MSAENNGGPAFPCPQDSINQNVPSLGVTVRDYFAAKALPTVLDQKDVHDGRQWSNAAWIAYQIADAMLAESLK